MIRFPRRQDGAALLAMLLVLALGGLWYLTTRVNAASGYFVAANRDLNARILGRAKQALLGYVARESANSGEANPGAFPCPEAAGNIGTANEGVAAGNCTLPAVGRLPWKTLGIEPPLDASGEPLWYVVANGWAKPNAVANTVINSNCTDSVSAMTCWSGQLTVDAQANAAVALIIAPGAAMNVQASAGCTARNQSRSAPAPTVNYLDYIECSNTGTSTFVTIGPSTSFNDQVIKITASEALPLIEAAVVNRLQKDIAPLLRTAYSGAPWPVTPVLPFAAPFADPTTSPFQGVVNTYQGLLPASYAFTASPGSSTACTPTPCTPTACTPGGDPRCDPTFVSWQAAATITRTGGANLESSSCSISGTPSTLTCVLRTYTNLLAPVTWMTFTVAAKANNAGMALRQLNGTVPIAGLDTGALNPPYGYTLNSATLNNDGSATANISAQVLISSGSLIDFVVGGLGLCSLVGLACYENTVSIPMAVFSDHPLVDPSNTTHNWFSRNRWPEVSYYAVAPGIAPSGARSCTDGTTCLQLTYYPTSGKQRAIVLLGGPKLAGQTRPAATKTDLLEGVNATADVTNPPTFPFALRSPPLVVNRTFNDHAAVIDANP